MNRTDIPEIQALLSAYETALNTSDAAASAALYAPDGVFFPYNLPTAKGADIQASYEAIFDAIRLDIAFEIVEVAVEGDLAFAVTGSRGTVTIHAAELTVDEENRELFVFRKVDGEWRIARYMFNKDTDPAAQAA